MMTIMGKLSAQHQALLALLEGTKRDDAGPQVQEFLKQLADAGTEVTDARERSQLRGLIRFWSSFIYDLTGQFPQVKLLPATKPVVAKTEQEERKELPLDDASLMRIADRVVELIKREFELEKPFETLKAVESGEYEPQQLTSTLTPGTEIGPYRIMDEFGEGGFSKVYKAHDTVTEETVALKVLHSAQFKRSRSFRKVLIEREQLIAELDHPNIIPVYSVAEFDGLPCIAMKFIESGSLADRLAHWYWSPSVRQILEIARQTTEGLAYLHDKQIVHRDIKPSNLLLSIDEHVYLTDFGITEVFESAFKGMVIGTPEYLAPEAILHPDNVDGRADLYALGIILFELFTGERPFQAESADELFHLQVNQPVPPLDVAPTEIAVLIHRCLAKDPDRRFASAAELRAAIEGLMLSLPSKVLDSEPAQFVTAPETRPTIPDTGEFRPLKALRDLREQVDTPSRFSPSSTDKQATYPAPLAILIVRAGFTETDHFIVRRSRSTIGSGDDNDIIIDRPSVSREHAIMIYEKTQGRRGRFTICDLGSPNGVLVNGNPCTRRRLEHNDTIAVGQVELLFKRLDDDPTQSPA